MIGQRGIPATWGGVERHVEELSRRMVDRGHEVVVYTRPNYTDKDLKEYKGVEIRSLPTIGTKHLDAIVHCGMSTLNAWGSRFDIVHYHAIGPSLLVPLARMRGFRVVSTVHARDWQRDKWGGPATYALRVGEWNALHMANATISVSQTLAEMYRTDYPRTDSVHFIPNGVSLPDEDDPEILQELGIAGEPFILFAGRIAPEKGAHYLLDAWRMLGRPMKLVIAGDTSFTDRYAEEIKQSEREGVIFPGYVYDKRLAALFRNAALFVLPSDVEGYPIVLLEAQGHGAPVLASDIPQNIEALADHGRYFKASDVASLSEELAGCLENAADMKHRAEARRGDAVREYDWDLVTDKTLEVYELARR